jgi:hypothetical protein
LNAGIPCDSFPKVIPLRIARQSPTELVCKDSIVWLAIPFGVAALAFTWLAITHDKPIALLGSGIFLLSAAITARSATFVFDGVRRTVRWNGRKLFKVDSGDIPFADITGIGVEAISSESSVAAYRLTILTEHGSVPMAYAYSNGKDRHARMRGQILAFVTPGAQSLPSSSAETTSSAALADEASIRSLLRQGRKIDAVSLLRSTERLSLTRAMQRINAIDDSMKAGK